MVKWSRVLSHKDQEFGSQPPPTAGGSQLLTQAPRDLNPYSDLYRTPPPCLDTCHMLMHIPPHTHTKKCKRKDHIQIRCPANRNKGSTRKTET